MNRKWYAVKAGGIEGKFIAGLVLCFIIAGDCYAVDPPVLSWKWEKNRVFEGEIVRLSLFADERGWEIDSASRVFIPAYLQDLGWRLVKDQRESEWAYEEVNGAWWVGYVYHLTPGRYVVGENMDIEAFEEGDDPVLAERSSIPTKSSSIQIKALPPSPVPRARCVGNFSITYGLAKKKYLTGEKIILAIRVEGPGNVEMLPAPFVEVPDKFLVYDPRNEIEWETRDEVLIGQKTYFFDLIGSFQGSYRVGPFKIYHFDPQKMAYDSLVIEGVPLRLEGKNIPQLLEVNALDNFYREKLRNASEKQVYQIPYGLWVALGCGSIAAIFLIWGLIKGLQYTHKNDV